MPTNEVLINREYKVLLIREHGASGSFPGFEALDTFSHGTDHDPQGWVGNHVDYRHIRDILYRAGELWPCDYMIMRARKPDDEAEIPLVPGPLDFFVDTNREESGTVRFQMALPNCLMMIVTYNDLFNGPVRNITATHGGESLQLLDSYVYRYHQISLFQGNGLTLEEADLVISSPEGKAITPIVGRITDLQGAVSPVDIVNQGYYSKVGLAYIGGDVPFMSKSVMVCENDMQIQSLTNQELVTNRRVSTGTPVEFAPTFGAGWTVEGTTWTHAGADKTFIEGDFDGDPTPSRKNGVTMHLKMDAEATLNIAIYAENGASTNITLAGPIDRVIHETRNVSGGYHKRIRITGTDNIVIKDFVAKKNMIALSVAMGHSVEPIEAARLGVQYTMDRSYYVGLTAFAYKEDSE